MSSNISKLTTYTRVNWEDMPSTNTPINATNLNTMDKAIYDNTAKTNEVIDGLDECFQSASNGKALIASAITGKGVSTASNASYATMAGNIINGLMKIPTATASITSNGTHDITNYKYASVNINTGASFIDMASGVGSPWWTATFPRPLSSYKYIICVVSIDRYIVLQNYGGTWSAISGHQFEYRNVGYNSIQFAQTITVEAGYIACAVG